MSWVVLGVAVVGAVSSVAEGQAAERAGQEQEWAAQARARQAESDANQQLIERKRELVETLAMQNVQAASQGRTIASIGSLQGEDIRRHKYDSSLISAGGSATASAHRRAGSAAAAAGKQAKHQSYIQAGSTLLSGGYQATKSS